MFLGVPSAKLVLQVNLRPNFDTFDLGSIIHRDMVTWFWLRSPNNNNNNALDAEPSSGGGSVNNNNVNNTSGLCVPHGLNMPDDCPKEGSPVWLKLPQPAAAETCCKTKEPYPVPRCRGLASAS